jgi:hypothetical protein
MTNNFQTADFPIDSGVERASSHRKFSLNKVQSYIVDGKPPIRETLTPNFIKMHRGVSDLDPTTKSSTMEKPAKDVWWNTMAKK